MVTKGPLRWCGPVPWTGGCCSEAVFKLCAQIGVAYVRGHLGAPGSELPLPFVTRCGAQGQGQ